MHLSCPVHRHGPPRTHNFVSAGRQLGKLALSACHLAGSALHHWAGPSSKTAGVSDPHSDPTDRLLPISHLSLPAFCFFIYFPASRHLSVLISRQPCHDPSRVLFSPIRIASAEIHILIRLRPNLIPRTADQHTASLTFLTIPSIPFPILISTFLNPSPPCLDIALPPGPHPRPARPPGAGQPPGVAQRTRAAGADTQTGYTAQRHTHPAPARTPGPHPARPRGQHAPAGQTSHPRRGRRAGGRCPTSSTRRGAPIPRRQRTSPRHR